MVAAAMQGADKAHQEQFGVQYLAQGHFDMQARGIGPETFSNNMMLSLPLSHNS